MKDIETPIGELRLKQKTLMHKVEVPSEKVRILERRAEDAEGRNLRNNIRVVYPEVMWFRNALVINFGEFFERIYSETAEFGLVACEQLIKSIECLSSTHQRSVGAEMTKHLAIVKGMKKKKLQVGFAT
ncbi:hypothetical protein NDU88_006791 [Pleurodeles waltl]|uniref:Uncharacterized protein n=1 Tax=Pleurodeles waltl TaxID=8319 RepID=A0AAV7N9N9_PLEWA|nr:hypothetical protein NDU88_006791 [Pleurodeles waltl]